MAEVCDMGGCHTDDAVVIKQSEPEVQEEECVHKGVIVYHRATCGRCWLARWQLWNAGVPFELRPLDCDQSWGDLMYKNGYQGGTFMLPVVTHGCKAWWDIKDYKNMVEEIKGRLSHEISTSYAAGM
uniref:Glutaredoxin domain-containing protein n=1 Tax=Hemiselmis andersenii TaxID=464988 RepID=A0A6U4JNI9_HEMAN|mmetsp:Transcript_14754/g.34063  ORF Transcript_14754/g.34063 Transcript_14754/m.34063 type:complete len:127 (+) Transcript_14754:110-490(+)